MKNYKLLFVVIFLLILCYSCHHDYFYEKVDNIDKEKWSKEQILDYQIDILDSTAFYDVYLLVRNTTDYQTQMLYLFLTTQFPTGVEAKDTLGCIISDPRGKWMGKGRGRVKENEFLLRERVRFPIKGSYHFKVQQAMRTEPLEGIESFGIRFDYIGKAESVK